MSVAVDDLTRRYGTLFVAASGNDGADGSVSTPAAATSALAVGSVSRTDVLSAFSNRGPRTGDGAVKPEIAAPGEGIVAAAPAGVPPLGEPVGDGYQRLDGTSMASPHVAGSAALLAQRHPDWSPSELKDALVSTAAEVADAGVFAVGAGRVDVARATGQAVTATGSVSAYFPWPNRGASRTGTVAWRNTGATPMTLALSTSLPSRFALSATSVTVPAGGMSTVDVTMSAVDGGAGTFGGVLVARGDDGSVTRTALSVRQQEEMFDLTVNLVNRDGQVPSEGDFPTVAIHDLDDSNFFYWNVSGTARLPAGRYAIHTTIETPRAGQEPSYSFISHPELILDRNVTQTFDARAGHPVSVTADNPAARGGWHGIQMMSRLSGCDCVRSLGTTLDPRFHATYAATVPGSSSPTYAFGQSRSALEPEFELFADDGQRFEVAAGWFDGSPEPTEAVSLPMVYGGQATPEDLAGVDAKGKLVVAELPGDLTYDEVFRRTGNIKAAGAKTALVTVQSALERTTADEPRPALPTLRANGPTAARLVALAKKGPATVRYASRPGSTLRYELAYGVQGSVTTAQEQRPRTKDLAAVRTGYHDNVAATARFVGAAVDYFGAELHVGRTGRMPTGQEVVEYFTPGRWDLFSSGYLGPNDHLEETIDLVGRRTYRVSWNKAVAGPAFPGTRDGERPWVLRDPGAIDVILPLYSDAAGHPRVPSLWDGIDAGSISLYREGELVGTVPAPDRARFEVPAEPGTYRLVAETTRSSVWWPQSTKVSAAWTFRSADGEPLSLLTATFTPDVDLRNRAPGGRFAIPVKTSTAVKTVSVDVSYDDGRTWHRAAVRGSGSLWTASVHHPRSGPVSLRTTVVDAAGNTLEQTVLKAYEIG